jgi:hypothetical protein
VILAQDDHESATRASSNARHSYQTPYGTLAAQSQPSGGWGAAYDFTESSPQADKLQALIQNVCQAIKELNCSLLPKFVSFDAGKRRVLWKFGRGQEIVPLWSIALPLPSSTVRSMIETLGGALEQLHSIGLGTFDLHPATIFVAQDLRPATMIPTAWLASQARVNPAKLTEMPCAAPELAQPDAYPEPARADVYGLGALAWLLLTGTSRKSMPSTLPSERSDALAEWDSFIDGCCRSNPERRFASVRNALAKMGSAVEPTPTRANIPPQAKPIQFSTAAPARRKRRATWSRRMALYGMVAGGATAAYFGLSGASQLLPTFGRFAPYRRGFADTIVAYRDRSYSDARWELLEESSAIAEGLRGDLSKWWKVAGWDDENYVVARDRGELFQVRNGHWSLLARIPDAQGPTLRVLGASAVMAATDGIEKHLHHVSARGVEDCGALVKTSNSGSREIIPVTDDLTCVLIRDGTYFGNWAFKYSAGQCAEISHETKQYLVHTTDNVPLKEYPIPWITFTAVHRSGEAWGVAYKEAPVYYGQSAQGWDESKIVRYADGLWYVVEDVPKAPFMQYIHGAWFGRDGDTVFVIVFGNDGYVLKKVIGGQNVVQPVQTPQEVTSRNLIKAWGVGPQKYWVLDDNGTVWERSDDESRVVVRGLRTDGLQIRSAWVSPNGNVVAVNDKHVYRLA